MRKPLIGLTAWCRTLPTSIGQIPLHAVSRFYVAAVEAAGGIPLLLPSIVEDDTAAVMDVLDGLIVTGGEDVDSARYGEQPHPKAQVASTKRDGFELSAVAEADERGLPTLAICRGIQVLNVARGGTLIQDVPDLVDGNPEHMRLDAWNQHVHEVALEPGTRVSKIFGGVDRLAVNSLHHQAVAKLGTGLKAVGWAPEGFVEAVEDERSDRFMVGLQWHPENLFEEHAEHLAPFRALVEAIRDLA
jgi:gamma-glutamyl-gamma-aminobutyrate hydrolase PuuD